MSKLSVSTFRIGMYAAHDPTSGLGSLVPAPSRRHGGAGGDGEDSSGSDSDDKEGAGNSDAHWTPSSKAAAVSLLTGESSRNLSQKKISPSTSRRRPSTVPLSPRSGRPVIGQGFAKVVAEAVTSSMYLTAGGSS